MSGNNAHATISRAVKAIKKGGANNAFEWFFNYPHIMHHTTDLVMQRPLHPLRELLLKRWNDADKTTLWIYVYSSNKVNKSSYIRGIANRRIRAAITEALKDNGLDRRGRSFDPGAQKSTSRIAAGPIAGTLSIMPKVAALHHDYQDLLQHSRKMVETISELHTNDQSGLNLSGSFRRVP